MLSPRALVRENPARIKFAAENYTLTDLNIACPQMEIYWIMPNSIKKHKILQHWNKNEINEQQSWPQMTAMRWWNDFFGELSTVKHSQMNHMSPILRRFRQVNLTKLHPHVTLISWHTLINFLCGDPGKWIWEFDWNTVFVWRVVSVTFCFLGISLSWRHLLWEESRHSIFFSLFYFFNNAKW